jgi:hypothetical protein
MLQAPTSPQDLQQNTTTKSAPAKVKHLMYLPHEMRRKILSSSLAGAAGPSGTISVNPRAKVLSDPTGEFHGHDPSGQGQTKWQARRGFLQT